MASGLTSPAGDELERLRQQYDRLCDLVTRTAESDPAGAERVLNELQTLSERIVALQASPGNPPPPAPAPPETAPAASPPEASAAAAGDAGPQAPAPSSPEPEPQAPPARIVTFRVTPSIGQYPVGDPAPAPAASWRLDAPPSDQQRRDMAAAGTPSPAPPPQAAPPASKAPAQTPGRPNARAAAAPRPSITVRKTPAAKPAAVQSSPTRPAPPRARAAQPTPAAPQPAGPTAVPQPPAAPQTAAPAVPGSATLFSSAIRQWLERHREEAEPIATPGPTPETSRATNAAANKKHDRKPDVAPAAGPEPAAPHEPQALTRLAAAIEQQAVQIERILKLCEAHQAALEGLEARIAVRLDAPRPAAPDPEFAELRAAVEEQRGRVTALAKTIHNLAQWLAAQRGS